MSPTEKKGIERLKKYLSQNGRKWKESDNSTFDLIVDEKYAEVKCKGNSFEKFDFIGLTPNQQHALEEEGIEGFILFIVCDVKSSNSIEVIEIPSNVLRDYKCDPFTIYYYYKGIINKILQDHREIKVDKCKIA